MQRIDNSWAVASLPAPLAAGTPGYFGRGNPSTGLLATPLSADWANMVQEEIMAVVLAAGLTPDKENMGQLLDALRTSGVFQTAGQFDSSAKPSTTEFVQRALGSLSGITYGGTRTLTAADSGKLSGISTGGAVLTLPVGSTLTAGASFHFWNGTSAGTGTVQRQGSDVIYLADSPVTSVAVNGGESLSLTWSGTAWYAIAGSSTLGKASSSFGASLVASGYQKLPSGLIVQWGRGQSNSYTFPIAFPNAVLRIIPAVDYSSSAAASNQYSNIATSSPTGFTTTSAISALSASAFLNYIAIGW